MLGKKLIKAAAGSGAAEETDENFNQTVLLLHGDGNQGATNFNNTGPTKYLAFSDNSDNNFPITVNGDARGDNTSPFQVEEGQWSNYFNYGDGSDYITFADSSAFALGSSEFTIECWLYNTLDNQIQRFAGQLASTAANTSFSFEFQKSVTNKFVAQLGGGATIYTLTSTNNIPSNQWVHLALVRDGNTARIYINGVQEDTENLTSVTINDSAGGLSIGRLGDWVNGASALWGYVSNFRLVVGDCVYPNGTTFTPPTSALTAITGTGLLTCQGNRFVNAVDGTAATVGGSPKVTPLNPFTTEYNTVAGSGYFDGTGDYLSVGAASDWTFMSNTTALFSIEIWFYYTSGGSFENLIATNNGSSLSIGITLQKKNDEKLFFEITRGVSGSRVVDFTSTGIVKPGSWNHVLLTYDQSLASGNLKIYINGASAETGNKTANAPSDSAPATALRIGTASASAFFVNGYVGSLRISNVVRSSGIPTAPFTSDSDTELLTCQYAGTVRNIGFIDSGPYDFPITRVGNTTQGTFSPFSAPDGRWSNFFDGNTDYLRLGSAGASSFSTNNFTIECWIYSKALGNRCLYDSRNTSTGQPNHILWTTNTSGQLVCYSGNTLRGTSTGTFFANTWNHVALVREGTGTNQTKFYINGVLAGTFTLSDNLSDGTNPVIGAVTYTPLGAASWNGYISNLRIVKGRAVYTSAFTPSTVPLGATSGGQNPPQGTETSLLTCQSNRFVDNSTNNFAITRNGDVKVTPFSPFAPTAAYDPAVNSGSGYFDGTGDYLTAPSNAAFSYSTGDFSLEFWAYPLANSDFNRVIFHSDDNFNLELIATTIRFFSSATAYTGGSYNANEWVHVCITRESGTARMFVDGVLVNNFAFTNSKGTSSVTIANNNSTQYFAGYLSNIRIVKGGIPSAYQTASTTNGTQIFTPQTTPFTGSESLTAGSVSLLLRGENAGIFDNTGKNVLETVGNAQVDTSVKKYGTGAMKFDGSDHLLLPGSPDLAFGTGDFTVEGWFYQTGDRLYPSVFEIGDHLTSTGIVFITKNNGFATIYSDGFFGSKATTLNAWNHIAWVRSSGVLKIYVNGVGDAGTSFTNNLTANNRAVIGTTLSTNPSNYWYTGFIDDLRITKGVARYTTTFTPPDKAFPDQ